MIGLLMFVAVVAAGNSLAMLAPQRWRRRASYLGATALGVGVPTTLLAVMFGHTVVAVWAFLTSFVGFSMALARAYDVAARSRSERGREA